MIDMSKYTEIFNYLRQCPQLADLWSVGATEDKGVNVVLPFGTSTKYIHNEDVDTLGNYSDNIQPYLSVYEEYQINCYRNYDVSDSSEPEYNVNVLNLDEVQEICDWIETQNENGNLPEITGKQVVSIECFPFNPQIRYINEQESTIGYYITIRIRYVNTFKGRYVEHECNC